MIDRHSVASRIAANTQGEPSESSAQLLDVKAVAALLGDCSTRHVYRLVDAGRMPSPVRLGALVRWRRTELMAWVENGCPSIRSAKGRDR